MNKLKNTGKEIGNRFECDCASLTCSIDVYPPDKEYETNTEISFFVEARDFGDRLKACYKMLRHGRLFETSIILQDGDTMNLSNLLKEYASEEKIER